ncbi:L-proline dehydrogenase [Zhouia amylolytica]|uniref:L-proline dehydrogenase n=1 Tax=Zhouia amylolytica TaxID=376730 RepID=A0A1I6UR93_9FLAO|nr:proline dehydrogenase family protein [Zhouia amylolytica]MCQ0110760.1 proline dehydrogenase family protein [Zhouia amylolytica]SFT03975.1 L-proline dehydrogenase [Zhouia amylolytica]
MNRIFDNTEVAFSLKSDAQLERAYFLFKMIANEPLVKIGTAVTNFAIKAHLPVEGLIRATVFDHFCGGVNEEDCLPIVKSMYEKGVRSVLDYSVEGKEEEAQFESCYNKVISLLDFAAEKQEMPFSVFKPTGFGRLELYQKVGEKAVLSKFEQEEWDRVVDRFDRVCQHAYNLGVTVLIDAEESWMQEAADQVIEQMMAKYNKKSTIVFNTLQMYRWDRLDYLKKLHERAKKEEFRLGFKLVRGAYMEKENERAEEMGYPTPICASKKETDENYDAAATYIMDNLETISIFAGTHNEASNYLIMDIMDAKGIKVNEDRVWFGQLYGMSDHITFNMAEKGYNVAKYLPYGPVRDVMPYLIRRAEENTSVAGQTTRELSLLKQERKRRKI